PIPAELRNSAARTAAASSPASGANPSAPRLPGSEVRTTALGWRQARRAAGFGSFVDAPLPDDSAAESPTHAVESDEGSRGVTQGEEQSVPDRNAEVDGACDM